MGSAVSIGKRDSKASRFATTSRKLTMRHTVRLDTEIKQKIQTIVLDMSKTSRVELTSSVDREGSGVPTGTLTQHGLLPLHHIPEIVLSMPHLTELNLKCNDISVVPKEIDALVALQVLILSKNKITVLPASLTKLTRLRVLEVVSNQLIALPESLGKLESLEELQANRNEIEKLPESIGFCIKLRILNVYNNALIELGKPVSMLPELVELNVSNNQLRQLPNELLQWKKLQRLLLQVNNLESLPALDNLWRLEVLQVQQNALKSLPSMGNLDHLVKLDANSNSITKLPAEVAHMSALTHLNLRRNKLEEIPPQLARCLALEILDLGENPVTSSIPAGFAELCKLRTLLLDGGNITVLPIELIGLRSVCRVHLGGCLKMDDPETCEVVLGLKDSCSRRGGWLKIGDRKTEHRTESMSSDIWELYDELEGQIPDEPARKSRVTGGEGSSDFFAGRKNPTQCR
ncbi:uncharacterized protein PITG_08737 [Phytophthora infestans T30-4]|uniref:Disease resistance R13L4/SHOC-2-like LRR domain-containing protein n=1 Tax=Phytophthora infestans (strain T30-4) TaxID=403677 RepID=D0ND32_PHYIT|nr:uncharacterized protein PITG_08737 [Phytophthora infestans T30-4]EEY55989.1 conserved hypothetical protein [Phytophthora infestans T30-4]|eukprot:XP_002902819.1 conserved hypothetical protein [Phytophthora infestans T30-4]